MSGDGVLAPNGLIVSVAAYPTTGDDVNRAASTGVRKRLRSGWSSVTGSSPPIRMTASKFGEAPPAPQVLKATQIKGTFA
jgi:hypothetical protein